jgi:hypothetical protein
MLEVIFRSILGPSPREQVGAILKTVCPRSQKTV